MRFYSHLTPALAHPEVHTTRHSTLHRSDWNSQCPVYQVSCTKEAQPVVFVNRTRQTLSPPAFIPNVLRNSKPMQKYQCGEKIQFQKCTNPPLCVPRCKEEWTAWHGGCDSKYCGDCCNLVQTRKLKMINGMGMTGGAPPVELRKPCLNKDYFWGYTKKMETPTYLEGQCIETLYRFAPFFPVGRG